MSYLAEEAKKKAAEEEKKKREEARKKAEAEKAGHDPAPTPTIILRVRNTTKTSGNTIVTNYPPLDVTFVA